MTETEILESESLTIFYWLVIIKPLHCKKSLHCLKALHCKGVHHEISKSIDYQIWAYMQISEPKMIILGLPPGNILILKCNLVFLDIDSDIDLHLWRKRVIAS